jgi:hypothetical protein
LTWQNESIWAAPGLSLEKSFMNNSNNNNNNNNNPVSPVSLFSTHLKGCTPNYYSYLLVVYYQNVRSYGAGMLTVLSNRIGGVALLMVIAWVINFGS